MVQYVGLRHALHQFVAEGKLPGLIHSGSIRPPITEKMGGESPRIEVGACGLSLRDAMVLSRRELQPLSHVIHADR